MAMFSDSVDVVIGVDTHKHTHTAAVVRAAPGAEFGYQSRRRTRPATPSWSRPPTSTPHCGCGRSRAPAATAPAWPAPRRTGETVIELDRPKRPTRRQGAKSDPLDAVRAAREALPDRSPRPTPQPRTTGRVVGSDHRARNRRRRCRRRPTSTPSPDRRRPRTPARKLRRHYHPRHGDRSRQAADHRLLGHREPRHCSRTTSSRSTLPSTHQRSRRARKRTEHRPLVATRPARKPASDRSSRERAVRLVPSRPMPKRGRLRQPRRHRPDPASSGLTTRHRLNRSGDRQLNRAVHVIVISRLRTDPATRAYAERRRAEGKTNREITRRFKRYIARQLFRQLERTT